MRTAKEVLSEQKEKILNRMLWLFETKTKQILRIILLSVCQNLAEHQNKIKTADSVEIFLI